MAEQVSIFGTVIMMMIVDFEKIAQEFKRFFGLDSNHRFPALNIAEKTLCVADSNFIFSVIADDEWKEKESVQAYYRHTEKVHEICIKESVYEKARKGDMSALGSILHELSHWALINYFKINLGIKDFSKFKTTTRITLIKIHENMADLLTALVLFSEEELVQAECTGNKVYNSCMGLKQISLALFYCQNHKMLTDHFIKKIMEVKRRKEDAEEQKKTSPCLIGVKQGLCIDSIIEF